MNVFKKGLGVQEAPMRYVRPRVDGGRWLAVAYVRRESQSENAEIGDGRWVTMGSPSDLGEIS